MKHQFYKSKLNKRILFGTPHRAIELVGPDGDVPNFECIKWNLKNYEVIENLEINLPLLNNNIYSNKNNQFTLLITKPGRYDEEYIFFNSKPNKKNKLHVIPYIHKRKVGRKYYTELKISVWRQFFDFVKYPPMGYEVVTDKRIVIKK